MKDFETWMENSFFKMRWLLAPFFIGLMVSVIALLIKFGKELFSLMSGVLTGAAEQPILSILTLIDTALLAGLLLIIAFSGYENFVSKFAIGDHEDRPGWMGKVGFADLKLKLIGAVVAISTVELLKAFLNTETLSNESLAWKVGIHIALVFSGLMFALTDYISGKGKESH